MPTILNNGIQLPDKGSVDWYSSMQSNYNLIDTHLGNTDTHVTAEDKANWNSKQGSLSQAQLDAIAQVATNTSDIATLQSGKANVSHTHSSSDITDIGDYATKQYVDNSISGLVDNAPAALDTLNELSAALNDDSNFASTVTNALATKANSADLATVATSGDYDDLSNKPSIPTNTSDLNNDSGFVTLNDFDIPSKTSDLTNDSGFITSSDVPTGTSDLINDSNFVDTSNSAVASGITSAKVTDYDTHIADTDKHVTTADKNKWNNQTYVFRYSSTTLVASSTNSNALLDNTDNLKVGDKVIDSSGVLFSITAIDTQNSTFTIGTALIDLAQDSDVVHKRGNETVGGSKTFDSNTYVYNSDNTATTPALILKNSKTSKGSTSEIGGQLFRFFDKNNNLLSEIESTVTSNGASELRLSSNTLDSNNQNVKTGLTLISNKNGLKRFCPTDDGNVSCGYSTLKWSGVYATNYYYGNDNVEFSTKFVTTDTNQTISGSKNFKGLITTTPDSPLWSVTNNTTADITSLALNCIHIEGRAAGSLSDLSGGAWYVAQIGTGCFFFRHNAGTDVRYKHFPTNVVSKLCLMSNDNKFISDLCPNTTNSYNLGDSTNKWKTINGLAPSSLSMPDLSNGVDISSYLTTGNSNNTYTPPANGWISISIGASNGGLSIFLEQGDMKASSYSVTGKYQDTDLSCFACLPVIAGVVVNIGLKGSGNYIRSAKFFPCQGNV